MQFQIFAPKGCGIKQDKRLRKLVVIADNVQDQKDLYELAGKIKVYKPKVAGEGEQQS